MKRNETDKPWIELQKTIERAHEAAKSALSGKEHGRLFEIASWLQQAENLIKRREVMETDASRLAATGNQILTLRDSSSASNRGQEHLGHKFNGSVHLPLPSSEKKSDAKARGRAWRLEYVKSKAQTGERLQRVTETLYQTPVGLVRGIAYASESPKRPDKWFLGLPKDQFQEVVLICESLDGSAVQIHLPPIFMDEHGRNFSSAHGQTLFNVIRNAGKFIVSIPNTRPVELTKYTEHGPSRPTSTTKVDISEFV